MKYWEENENTNEFYYCKKVENLKDGTLITFRTKMLGLVKQNKNGKWEAQRQISEDNWIELNEYENVDDAKRLVESHCL